jgi:small GTP-binding protein
MTSDPLLKLLLIGESSVGKSCLLLRYADNRFQEGYFTTIGIDFKVRSVTIENTKVRLQIWDTAGQEQFRTITKAYYHGAHGILLVFDVSNAETFAQCQGWMNSISESLSDPVEIALVGNKCDMERQVTKEQAQEFADRYGVRYFETSAKTGENVESTFLEVAKMVVSNEAVFERRKEMVKLQGGKGRDRGKKPCC